MMWAMFEAAGLSEVNSINITPAIRNIMAVKSAILSEGSRNSLKTGKVIIEDSFPEADTKSHMKIVSMLTINKNIPPITGITALIEPDHPELVAIRERARKIKHIAVTIFMETL